MSNVSIPAKKKEMRQKIKHIWNSQSQRQREIFEKRAIKKISNLKTYKTANTIFLFSADKYEISLSALLEAGEGKRFCFPSIDSENQMRFQLVKKYDELQIAHFGIAAPCGKKPDVIPQKGDVMIVPAQAVDERNYRLGRGKGYYDRFLSQINYDEIELISVVPYFSFFKKIPIEPHDICVKNVVIVDSMP